MLHYNNAQMGGAFLHVLPWSLNQLLMMMLESVFICAVNLFVLISGFFMANKKSADLLKPFTLIVQVIVYAVGFYLVMILMGFREFNGRDLLRCFIPNNWFVIIYSALFVITPFINHFLDSLDLQNKRKLVIVLLLLFSVYPSLADTVSVWINRDVIGLSSISMYGSQEGYTITNFCLMYIVGNYLNDIDIKDKNCTRYIIGYVATVSSIFVWSLLDNVMLHDKHSSWSYCNPLVIAEAVLIFQIFRSIDIKNNRLINRLASASFSVYIFHTKVIGKVGVELVVNKTTYVLVLHLCICVVCIYFISWVLAEIYSVITRPIINRISDNWKHNRIINI